jgi:alkylation response protein AidB-like acyl-CoA dehydrogenase
MGWPRTHGTYGNRTATLTQQVVWAEEYARSGAPPRAGHIGENLFAPTLLAHGTEEQRTRFLPPVARGEEFWCQGYSEPGAGSDLASLQTRAVRDGDDYVVNGQKIWTTGAHMSDWMFCLVRTDGSAPKHQGISFILFDLKSPGVTVKPIRLISGQSQFCEVFFEDVRALARNLIGRENDGWTIAKRLLQYERNMLSGLGGGMGFGARRGGDQKRGNDGPSMLAESARRYLGNRGESTRLDDDELRDEICQLELDQLAFTLTMRRSAEEARTQGPSAASSMFKLYMSELGKRRAEVWLRVLGYQALGWEGDAFTPEELGHTRGWLRSKGSTIEGGTSEIQRNVIAKRVLNLPSSD